MNVKMVLITTDYADFLAPFYYYHFIINPAKTAVKYRTGSGMASVREKIGENRNLTMSPMSFDEAYYLADTCF